MAGNLEVVHSGKLWAFGKNKKIKKNKKYKFKAIKDYQRKSVVQVGFQLRK